MGKRGTSWQPQLSRRVRLLLNGLSNQLEIVYCLLAQLPFIQSGRSLKQFPLI